MPDDQNPPAGSIPPILTGPELYDSIMGEIEEDLMNDNLEVTKQVMAEALPEDRAEMLARYDKAFSEYDKRAAQYEKDWGAQLHTYKRTTMHSLEEQTRNEDEAPLMQEIEAQMSNPSA